MSLLKLYALAIQTDPALYKIIHNTDNEHNNLCQNCTNDKRIPKLFAYYGPALCSKLSFPDYNTTYYNTMCDMGHVFISHPLFFNKPTTTNPIYIPNEEKSDNTGTGK